MNAFILSTGLELASRQNAKQDTSCLPSLNIAGKPWTNVGFIPAGCTAKKTIDFFFFIDIDPKIKPVTVDDVMLGTVDV